MKKTLLGIISVAFIIMLLGFGPFKDIKNKIDEIRQPEHEKIDDARGILDKVLEHIAHIDPKLSFEDGKLLDSELGVPRFDILPFSEIEHFNAEDIIDGYVVRPVVEVDNPRLLIVLEAVDKDASVRAQEAFEKVKSDQSKSFKDSGIWNRYLINESKRIRQGTFLIYVAWEDPNDIVKIFERHVR